MTRTELRHTRFDAVPLRNVVGVGNNTAYQISVSRGKTIAVLGNLDDFVNDSPANASHYDNDRPDQASVTRARSWFRRVVSR